MKKWIEEISRELLELVLSSCFILLVIEMNRRRTVSFDFQKELNDNTQ